MMREVRANCTCVYARPDGTPSTVISAYNVASSLCELQRLKEAKTLLRKIMPSIRRVLGESHEVSLRASTNYAAALYEDPSATLDDLREAVETLEELAPYVQRVMGSAHPLASAIKESLQVARATLRARETPSPGDA